MGERLTYALATIEEVDLDDLRPTILELRETHRVIQRDLNGDSLPRKLGDLAAPSLSSRISNVVRSTWSTSHGPTTTHRQQAHHASAGLPPILERLSALEASIAEIEQKLIDAGAPYVPGRLPTWPR